MQFTKQISFKTKVISTLLAIVLAFCFMLPSAIFTLSASASSNWDTFTIKGLQEEYDAWSEITLPTVSVSDATMLLKDPQGNDITASVNEGKFNATKSGAYQLSYTRGNASTGIINLNVVAQDVSFEFPENTDKIIPSKIVKGTTVVFPNPTILNEDGEVLENERATIEIVSIDKPTELLTVPSKLIDDVKFNYFLFNPITDDDTTTYEITYSYGGTLSSGANRISKKYSIEVVKEYESEEEISFNLKSGMPTSAIQGEEVTLPNVTGKNSEEKTIEVYTTITVTHVSAEDVKTNINVKDFKFIPSKSGNYEILYTVKDFFGNQTQKTYVINDVTDTKAPEIRVVDNYTVTENEVAANIEDTLVDLEDSIPTQIVTGTQIAIPAIFASDNVAEYKDITVSRKIKKDSTVLANLDDATAYPNNKKNESVNYTFDETGTYTLVYSASDGKNTTSDSQMSFTIKVIEDTLDNADTVVPTVIVNDFVKNANNQTIYSVKPNQKIKVAMPTVTDFVEPSDASNTSVYDSSPTLKVFMYVTGQNISTKVELVLDDKGEYFVGTVPSSASVSLTIRYEAEDDSARLGLYTPSNTDYFERTIDVIDTNDSGIPYFSNDFSNLPEIAGNQFDTIELLFNNEKIEALDSLDKNLQISINVLSPNGEQVDLIDYERQVTPNTIGDTSATATAKFVANLAGVYKVTYIAKDAGGNYAIAGTTINITSVAKPMITLSDYETTMELGDVIIPKASVFLDGVQQSDSWIQTTVFGDVTKNNEVIRVEYVAKDPSTNRESEKAVATFTIKDTKSPTILFENDMNLFAKLTAIENSNPVKYKAIAIPAWTAKDNGSGIDFSTIKITAVDTKGNTVTLIDSNGNETTKITGNSSACQFIPTKDGKYTITFSVSDKANNTTTETKTVSVGDITPPTITIDNKDTIPTTAKLVDGSYTLSLNVNADNVSISDNKDEDLTISNYLTVTVSGPSGSTISANDDDYNYTLTEAGTYTIKYVATDKAGNTKTETFSLVLSAENNEGATVTEVLGTLLLIFSILVLAGVVWYFVKPAPKAKNAQKKQAKAENENKDN